MKRQLLALSRRYQAALQKNLRHAPDAGLQPAHRLGQQAVTLGLETLDLARIHKTALAAVMRRGQSAAARERMVTRAGVFFTEAIAPIEKNHRAGRKSAAALSRQNRTLTQRTAQLAAANRHLKKGIIRRKAVEETLKTTEQRHAKLLKESRHLQKHLQNLTRRILSAQEHERKKMSRGLREEIAQTLLGINVRLLALKLEATAHNEGFPKKIANTQRLVKKSVKTINRFAHEFGVQP